jgi:hypothetical protein
MRQDAVVNRRFSIPSCLIFDSSVEAGTPSVAAAPRGPATFPRLFARAASIKNPPPGAPVPPILPPQDGYPYLDRTRFRESFAADVSADAAAFMADSRWPFER